MRWPILLTALAACTGPQPYTGAPDAPGPGEPVDEAPAAPTGERSRSGTLIVRDTGAQILVDADRDMLVLQRLDGRREDVPLPGTPHRAVAIGDDVFVTLRRDGAVLRLTPDGDSLRVAAQIDLGAEPYDVVASPQRSVLYVSRSQANEIVVLDAATLDILDRWDAPGEPRWMVAWIDDTGVERVAAACVQGRGISVWDALTAERSDRPLPAMSEDLLIARPSGELMVTVGDRLLVPSLYVDPDLQPDPRQPTHSPYAGPPAAAEDPTLLGRFQPALVVFQPGTPATAANLATLLRMQERTLRGRPTSVDVTADAPMTAVVAFDGARALVTIDLSQRLPLSVPLPTLPEFHRATHTMQAEVDSLRFRPGADDVITWANRSREFNRWPASAMAHLNSTSMYADDGFLLPESDIPANVRRGRELFFAHDDPTVAARSSGAGCASCHDEGRTDGITWLFEDMPRQTPSLSGQSADAGPFTWLHDVPSVAAEADLTIRRRLGGLGISEEDSRAIAAFLAWQDYPSRPADDEAAITRGRAIFRRADVGCASCHQGDLGTVAIPQAVGGRVLGVPLLRGIGASAPYLHDGSAPTLRDVLERARTPGWMGDTSTLSDAEMDDLEAFLKAW